MSVSILLADDHAIVRDGLRAILKTLPDFEVVGDVADGLEAVRQAIQLQPDIVIMDITMPNLNGIDAARRIRAQCHATKVIILSMSSTLQHTQRALRAGALGFVLKDAAGADLINAIRTVYAGQRYLSPKVADTLLDEFVEHYMGEETAQPWDRLTEREMEVLQAVVDGSTSEEIGELLGLSPKTVGTYRSRLMQKLGIENVPDLVKFAIRHGLISL